MALREAPSFLEELGPDWTVQTATNGQDALTLLASGTIVAVLANLRLPGQSGTQFLDTVMQQFPAVHRFILADLADKETMLKCVATAHQFISTPCGGRVLLAALERSFKMELLFGSDAVKQVVSRVHKMPSPPTSYFQIVRELQSPASSMDSIGAIISQDLAITAKMLQMVNSAAFGLQRQVSDSAEAVLFLGIETTKSLVLLAHTFSYFDNLSVSGFSIENLWNHSLSVGRLARAVARAENARESVREKCFTAGLLHDLGKLLIAANQPAELQCIAQRQREGCLSGWQAEQAILGTTHAELGAWLAAIWGLPLSIVEGIALHHHPSRFLTSDFCPLTAVHIANSLCREFDADGDTPVVDAIDEAYLSELKLLERLEVWRQLGHSLWVDREAA